MKANELSCKDLMVGDWVYNYIADMRYQVYPQFFSQWYDRSEQFEATIQPIPLTPEILEKNGFVKFIAGQYILPKGDNEWMVNIVPNLSSAPNSNGIMLVAIKNIYTDAKIAISYVHELQHALRLCKIEKEIIL